MPEDPLHRRLDLIEADLRAAVIELETIGAEIRELHRLLVHRVTERESP
jgi:hypothetical protein